MPEESSAATGPGGDAGGTRRAATAFVPGHVTVFFSAHPDEDPRRAGSRGAGLALADGVRVTVRVPSATDRDGGERAEGDDEQAVDASADDRPASAADRVTLNGDPTRVAPVGRVLDGLGAPPGTTVVADSPLPLGTGFGVSGGLALGTALAADAAVGSTRTENELVELAHTAEVAAGTGLGDVVAQARGGVPVRLDPGVPPRGRLDGLPARPRLEYVSFGDLSTERVLEGDTTRLTAAGERALDRLRGEPTLARLFTAGRTFAREADLLVPEVAEAVEAVGETGGEATMAMLGRSVVALGDGLTAAGYDPTVCRVHAAGATLLEGEDASATGAGAPHPDST
jgi:pantoate kinase